MWIMLSSCFLSVVDKGDPSGQTLLVRARRAGDIEAVFPKAQVVAGAGTDYAFRARLPREEVAQAIAEQVRSVAYPNYKASVTDDAFHDALMRVWHVMADLQRDPDLRMSGTVFEGGEDLALGPYDVDGMAEIIAEAETKGWEGEHVFDASVEDPPHPFWDREKRRCKD